MYGRDTVTFYYPLSRWAAAQWASGTAPLWIPLIFGGYPLFADGEVGPAYPLAIALYWSLPFETAYAWLRASTYLLAALSAYTLARVLGTTRFGAVVAGASFALGGFFTSHMQHDNIIRSAALMPLLLSFVELSLRARNARRWLLSLAGALTFALQCLGVHIQPVLLSAALATALVIVGPLVPQPSVRAGKRKIPSIAASRSWLVSRAALGVVVLGLGGGLAAIQLVPLYVLGTGSLRPGLVTYEYATSYALSPLQILTLLFPYMLHFDQDRSWALWAPHESTLYVGVVPLTLAILVGFAARGRVVVACLFVALLSLVLALGDYFPIKLYALVHQLPGFSVLRAPGRFALTFGLAVAILAGVGVSHLEAWHRRGFWPRGLRFTLNIVIAVAAALPVLLQALRAWMRIDPSGAIAVFEGFYLSTSKENGALGPWHVYYGVQEFTRPDNWRTLLGIALLGGTALLVRLWLRLPRHSAVPKIVVGTAVLCDMYLFASHFYPAAAPSEINPATANVERLKMLAQGDRFFVEPDLNPRLGANQLAAAGVATINGYSSLEPPRFSAFWWSVVNQDNFLLDLFNVKYIVSARRPVGERVWAGVTYHPSDRLLSGVRQTPGGSETFALAPTITQAIIVVAAVEGMGEPRPGEVAATIELNDGSSAPTTVSLIAGQHVDEYLAAEPGLPSAGYSGARVVWAGPRFAPTGTGTPARLYGAALPLERPVQVRRLVIRTELDRGRLDIHGLGLRQPDGVVRSLHVADREKYTRVFEDQNLSILENRQAAPRVSVVGGAIRPTEGVSTLSQMSTRGWRPDREAFLEPLGPAEARDAAVGGEVGSARVEQAEPSRVDIAAGLTSPGYVILADRYDAGWRVYVDGVESPLLRANEIARAVAVPEGQHTITFMYQPWPLRIGAAISLLSLAAVLTIAAWAAMRGARHQWRAAIT
ncbi:MAG: YfhO family protein [Chloroflexota bacterium]